MHLFFSFHQHAVTQNDTQIPVKEWHTFLHKCLHKLQNITYNPITFNTAVISFSNFELKVTCFISYRSVYFNFPLVLVGCSLRSQLLVIAPWNCILWNVSQIEWKSIYSPLILFAVACSWIQKVCKVGQKMQQWPPILGLMAHLLWFYLGGLKKTVSPAPGATEGRPFFWGAFNVQLS